MSVAIKLLKLLKLLLSCYMKVYIIVGPCSSFALEGAELSACLA